MSLLPETLSSPGCWDMTTSGHPSYSFVYFFPLFFWELCFSYYPLDASASQVYFLGNGSGTSHSSAGTIPEPSGLFPRLPVTSIQGCQCQCLYSDTFYHIFDCWLHCHSTTLHVWALDTWDLTWPTLNSSSFFSILLLLTFLISANGTSHSQYSRNLVSCHFSPPPAHQIFTICWS